MGQLNRLRIVLLIILLIFLSPSWAVKSANKFWSLLTLTGNYGLFLYNIEPQLRLIDASRPLNQFLANSGGGFQITPAWQFWLGQTLSTVSQDAEPGDFEEYRIWEQLVWQHQFNLIRLTSRTRLEQRKSFDYSTWANRLRERMLINVPLTTNYSLAVSNEILVNLNQVPWIATKTWDQNRAYVGIVQQLSESAFLSAGYMNQWIYTPIMRSDRVFLVNLQINLAT